MRDRLARLRSATSRRWRSVWLTRSSTPPRALPTATPSRRRTRSSVWPRPTDKCCVRPCRIVRIGWIQWSSVCSQTCLGVDRTNTSFLLVLLRYPRAKWKHEAPSLPSSPSSPREGRLASLVSGAFRDNWPQCAPNRHPALRHPRISHK